MKRCLGMLLALILLCGQVTAPALAEQDTVAPIAVDNAQLAEPDGTAETLDGGDIAADVDPSAPELIDGEGNSLTLDLGADILDEAADPDATAQPEADATSAPEAGANSDYDYGRAPEAGATVFELSEEDDVMGTLAGGAVALLTGERAGDRVEVAFNVNDELIFGWMTETELTLLTEEEKLAYLDAAAEAGALSYDENLDNLLMRAEFTPYPAEEEGEEGESPENPAPTNEPTVPEDEEPEGGETFEGEEEDDGEAWGDSEQYFAETGNGIMPSFYQAQMGIGSSRAIEVKDVSLTTLPTEYLTFTSSDPSVATVDANGNVTGRGEGTAIITVTYAEGRLSCTVWVQVVPQPDSISASPATRTIGVGERYTGLKAVFPVGTASTVTYTSSDPDVVKVNAKSGIITGRKVGSATITLTSTNGKKATCAVTVMKAATRVTLNSADVALAMGGRTAQLSASFPKNTTGGALVWESSDEAVATVSNSGKVTSVRPGEATITVKTLGGTGSKTQTAECNVTVTNVPARAYYNVDSVNLLVKSSVTPEYTVLDAYGQPAEGQPSFRIVSASPEGCVSLNEETGAVKGLEEGSAVIAFSTYNAMAAENTVRVNVRKAVKKIKLKAGSLPTTGYLAVGQQYSGWKVTLTPSDAYSSVTFTSSKPSVLKVVNEATGLVEGVKPGTAYITVSSHNGKKAKVKVIVKKAPTRVAITPSKAVLKLGGTGKYSVNLYGAGGSYSIVSSDPSVATVTASGKVVAKGEGTTTITVRTEPSGKEASSTLVVRNAVVPGLPAALYSNTATKGDTDAEKIEYVIFKGQTKAGCKYVYGGGYGATDPKTFDCSGFTYWCYKQAGIILGASAYRQGNDSKYEKIANIADLKRGDVVCFHKDLGKGKTATEAQKKEVSHVGLYLGSGYFIHASSSGKKVMVSQFKTKTTDYYQRCFSWGRRILD